jgi:hypothetical protein
VAVADAAPAEEAEAPAEESDALAEEPAVADAPAEEPVQIPYVDPPEEKPTEDAIAALAALNAEIPNLDYQRARYHPLHFKPAIDTATNDQCLACHQEILTNEVRATSIAGVKASTSLAWYQELSTYQEEQMTFHQRHLTSAYSQSVMNLQCNFCHQGNDPREESPRFVMSEADQKAGAPIPFTNRKMVDPSKTCLLCHGAMPNPEEIMALPGPWHEARLDIEDEETPNGCLTCHGEGLFRTNRHNVTYLKAASIEALAELSSDVCHGCHGGRPWYRISYPYPRHPYPGMDPEVPEWATGRPTESDARYILQQAKP